MEGQKLKFEQEKLQLEQQIVDSQNEYKKLANKQIMIASQNKTLTQQNERLKEMMSKHGDRKSEYEEKMKILQAEHAQIAQSCKAYEESMEFELNRKKEQMEAMFFQKEKMLRKQLYKQIRDELQTEMDNECLKIMEMQEKAKVDLNELDVTKQHCAKQAVEINALKMSLIETQQSMQSETQSLLSQIGVFEKQMAHTKQINATQQAKIKAMEQQMKMDADKSKFQFNLMSKQHEKAMAELQSELEVEKVKNASIQSHFEEKEDEIKKDGLKKSDQVKAELIEQQLAYLDSVETLRYHEGIHDEISHQIAVSVHKNEQQKRKQKELQKQNDVAADSQIAAALNEQNLKFAFKYQHELMEIVHMGFNDIDTIKQLLIKYKGNREKVIQRLIR